MNCPQSNCLGRAVWINRLQQVTWSTCMTLENGPQESIITHLQTVSSNASGAFPNHANDLAFTLVTDTICPTHISWTSQTQQVQIPTNALSWRSHHHTKCVQISYYKSLSEFDVKNSKQQYSLLWNAVRYHSTKNTYISSDFLCSKTLFFVSFWCSIISFGGVSYCTMINTIYATIAVSFWSLLLLSLV